MPLPQLSPGPNVANALTSAESLRGAETRNALLGKQLRDYDTDRNWLRKQRKFTEKNQGLQYEKDVLEWGIESLSRIRPEDYPTFKQHAEQFGVNRSLLPDPQVFADPATGQMDVRKFEAWRQQATTSASERMQLLIQQLKSQKTDKTFTVSPGQTVVDAKGKVIYSAPAKDPKSTKPKTFTVSPGQTVVDEAGKVIYSAPAKDPKSTKPKTFTVSPGQTVVDEAGKVIYTAPAKDTGEEVPPRVKQAQQLVLKYARDRAPSLVDALIVMQTKGKQPDPAAMLKLEREIPSELKPMYGRAVKILNEYYGVKSEPGSEVTHEFIPGRGLVPVQ